MDAGFQDLDILMTRIRNPRSKQYFLEAVKSYKAGALRSSLSAAWVAVVYDLIAKYRELQALGDAAATAFLQDWDQATANNNTQRLLALERTILDDAVQNAQVLNELARRQLQRLKEDRHLCAHPAYSEEAALFEPTPELARMHLVNTIDLVLSQQPLQGRAVLEQFSADIQSPGFPIDAARIPDYVEQRYIQHIRAQNIRNLGAVLAKALLTGAPPEWQAHRRKVLVSLQTIRDRAPASWDGISTSVIQSLNAATPAMRPRVLAFMATFPAFWERISDDSRTALQQTAANMEAAGLQDFLILSSETLPAVRNHIGRLIAELTTEQVMEALRIEPLDGLWGRARDIYRGSRGFRGSEINFRDFIVPFAGRMNRDRYDELLRAIMENGQNWNAGGTPDLLFGLMQSSAAADYPSRNVRDEFLAAMRRHERDNVFIETIELLQTDGWQPAAAEAAGD